MELTVEEKMPGLMIFIAGLSKCYRQVRVELSFKMPEIF